MKKTSTEAKKAQKAKTKSKKPLFLVIAIIVAALLAWVLFFVIEFPSLAHNKGGCHIPTWCTDSKLCTGIESCVEPCKKQSLWHILVDGC